MDIYSKTIIVIPTLNERENLEKLIPAIFDLIPDINVLVADDNSKDGTEELINNLRGNFIRLFFLKRLSDRGYGRSCLEAFQWAINRGHEYIVTMDADFSHDFNSIPQIIAALTKADMVVGSRYVKGGEIENWSLRRRMLSKFANLYVRTILGLPIRDVTTGFNGYRATVLKKDHLSIIKSDGYAFLTELKYYLIRAGATTIEIPITFRERREGLSKMSSVVIWEAIWLPWRLIL